MSPEQQAERDLTVAVDVGGTNTDAVCLDRTDRIVAWHKHPTTEKVDDGLGAAIATVLAELGSDAARVGRVMLGTTHATNAILQRRDLGRVAVIRIGAPATTEVPPLSGWPADLREAVDAGTIMISGGHFVDGSRIGPLDLAAVDRFVDTVVSTHGSEVAFAVTAVFSPADGGDEEAVAGRIRDRLGPDAAVCTSHEIGTLGLLERENATVLNAALAAVAGSVTSALGTVVAAHGLEVATFFAQNDGTLMALDHAARFPVLTIGSGPANSLRGAAFLSGEPDAVVADVGGTSTDLGVLNKGFPRESSLATDIGGVRTNFRMPDILAIALGGGTVIGGPNGGGSGPAPQLGPQSVGYRLTREALCCGGSVPTLTDAALLGGRRPPGDGLDAPAVDRSRRTQLAAALVAMDEAVVVAVDRVSLGRFDRPLVVVGGGSFMIADRVEGTRAVIRPEHADVANAVGAAIAPVSGRAEVLAAGHQQRSAAIEEATATATARAVQAGALPGSVEVIEVVQTPLTYVQQPSVRVTVKVAGRLGWL